ncbi:MAG: tetratricopeptide repeat protein, partial [Lysobacteraceae bacterium]
MNDPKAIYAEAVDALNRGDWTRADVLATGLVGRVPPHAGLHFVAGVAALNLARMPDALKHLQRAVQLNPARADYGAQFAKALATGRMMRQALAAADAAVANKPADPVSLDTLGIVYTQGNRHALARDMFEQAVAMAPQLASYHFNLATSLTFVGELAAAERALEACLACDPHYWKAHLALSKLRRVGATDNHLDRLRQLLAQFADEARPGMFLNLAVSKELE